MKKTELLREENVAKLIVLSTALALVASIITAFINHLMKQRLLRKLTRCVDSLQKAIPTMELASQMYIEANLDEEEPSLKRKK